MPNDYAGTKKKIWTQFFYQGSEDLNHGHLGVKHERNICAVVSPAFDSSIHLPLYFAPGVHDGQSRAVIFKTWQKWGPFKRK